MTHHTKDKGDIAVAKMIADLEEQGIKTLTPTVSEHLPFDLIAVHPETFQTVRIQVKYRSEETERPGVITCSFYNNASNSNGLYKKRVDHNSFDAYAIYAPSTRECYYVKLSDLNLGRKQFTLRLIKPRNRNQYGTLLASDFVDPFRLF